MELATSSLIFLSDKVDSLLSYYEITIGVMGVLLVIFGGAQIFFSFRYSKSQLEEIKEQLKKENQATTDGIRDELLSLAEAKLVSVDEKVEVKLKVLSEKIEEMRTESNAEFARIFAITAQSKKLYVSATFRWLKAAVGFSELDEDALLSTSLGAAQDSANQIVEADMSNLRSQLPEIEKSLKELESARKTEAQLIRETLQRKLRESVQGVPAQKVSQETTLDS